jgi:hypothetical protein
VIIKYRTNSSNNYFIKTVEVLRETEQYVFFASGRREQKSSCYRTYFDTRAEARAYLIERLERSIAHAQEKIDRDKTVLEKLRKEEGA